MEDKEWKRKFLSHVTYLHLQIGIVGFFAYAQIVLNENGPAYVPFFTPTQALLKRGFPWFEAPSAILRSAIVGLLVQWMWQWLVWRWQCWASRRLWLTFLREHSINKIINVNERCQQSSPSPGTFWITGSFGKTIKSWYPWFCQCDLGWIVGSHVDKACVYTSIWEHNIHRLCP